MDNIEVALTSLMYIVGVWSTVRAGRYRAGSANHSRSLCNAWSYTGLSYLTAASGMVMLCDNTPMTRVASMITGFTWGVAAARWYFLSGKFPS